VVLFLLLASVRYMLERRAVALERGLLAGQRLPPLDDDVGFAGNAQSPSGDCEAILSGSLRRGECSGGPTLPRPD